MAAVLFHKTEKENGAKNEPMFVLNILRLKRHISKNSRTQIVLRNRPIQCYTCGTRVSRASRLLCRNWQFRVGVQSLTRKPPRKNECLAAHFHILYWCPISVTLQVFYYTVYFAMMKNDHRHLSWPFKTWKSYVGGISLIQFKHI